MYEDIRFPPPWGVNTPPDYAGPDDPIDEALQHLLEPGQVVELRVLGARFRDRDNQRLSGFFRDHEALRREAMRREAAFAHGLYITTNKLRRGVNFPIHTAVTPARRGGCTSNDLVQEIRHILLDFDPARPDGLSADDGEHRAALQRAREAVRWLHERDVFASLADSGNGGHVLVRVSLPCDPYPRRLIDRFMMAVGFELSDLQVALDPSTGNPARLVRLPGTMNRKGPDLPDRPHRRSEMLAMLPADCVTDTRALRKVAALVPERFA